RQTDLQRIVSAEGDQVIVTGEEMQVPSGLFVLILKVADHKNQAAGLGDPPHFRQRLIQVEVDRLAELVQVQLAVEGVQQLQKAQHLLLAATWPQFLTTKVREHQTTHPVSPLNSRPGNQPGQFRCPYRLEGQLAAKKL